VDFQVRPASDLSNTWTVGSELLIIFDRESYSPAFFRKMGQQHRIACITYHKYPKEARPESQVHRGASDHMMEQFAIDALNEYRTEPIPGTNFFG
jgi:hypothetical protein